ncbi:MAG: hypothetical protein K0Q72_785 [Armatimonadetes bacterium]|nr:hypothetical protein [Armatimonadota bacterium]
MGLDIDFIHRVYRTSLVLVLLGAVVLWEAMGPRASMGWLVGGSLSLLMLAGVEWSIRRFITPETQSPRGLLGMLLAKLLGAALLLALAFVAALKGWLALLWILPGFGLPHLVIVLKLVGQKVRGLYAADQNPVERK